jgi:hypothetical protein
MFNQYFKASMLLESILFPKNVVVALSVCLLDGSCIFSKNLEVPQDRGINQLSFVRKS